MEAERICLNCRGYLDELKLWNLFHSFFKYVSGVSTRIRYIQYATMDKQKLIHEYITSQTLKS